MMVKMKNKSNTLFLLLLFAPALVFSQTTEYVSRELQNVKTYIEDKNYAQGLSTLNELLQKNPNDNNIYRSYSELLLDLGQYDMALSNIQKAILLSKANPSNHLMAGNIYRAKKDFSNAQQSYNSAIRLNPGMGEAYTEFSLLNLQHHFLRDAQRLAELAYHYNPTSWQNIILRANIANNNNQRNLAQQIFLEGIQNYPYNEQLIDAFAEFYVSNNEFEKAVIILKESNARFGESFSRNQLLGDSAFTENNQTEAIQYYEILDNTYTELNLPPSSLIKWRLHILYHNNEQIDKAHEFLQNALELDPLNQLYISTFYQHLLLMDNIPLRTALAKHLEKIAQQERKNGINYYHLTLLQKILSLTPSNNNARKHLLDYAKIQQNEANIQKFLEETIANDKFNQSILSKLSLRNHLEKTKRLNQSERPIYQFTNKIFVDDNLCYFANSVQKEFENLETFFPELHNQIELRQNFNQESRTLFQTNTNYNIVSHLYVKDSTVNVDIFDKKGLPITTFKQGFSDKNFTRTLIAFTQYIDELLPSIGYIYSRQADSQFKISLGSKNNISTNTQVAILDRNFKPLTTAEVISVSPYESTIKQLSIPLQSIDIESAYIVPVEYTSNTQSTNIIKDIDQISQIRYSKQASFSH